MKRFFIVLLLFFLQTLNGECEIYYGTDMTPQSRTDYAEMKVFGETFPDKNIEERLTALENKIFGSRGSGDIYNRMRLIEKITTRKISPKTRLIQNLKKSINNQFYGYPTGFTPPIYHYDNQYYRNTMPTYLGPASYGFYNSSRPSRRIKNSDVNSSTVILKTF